MTPSETPTLTSPLTEVIRNILDESPIPLKLAEVVKALPKPKKKKGQNLPDPKEEAQKLLEEEVQFGRAFAYPSAKNNEFRYWAKDEKHLLREKAIEFAKEPQAISALKTKVGKELKGTDGAFVEAIIRELSRDDVLFEHPAPAGGRGVWYGASPLPPVHDLYQEHITERLEKAIRPQKLAELLKGVPNPRRISKEELQERVVEYLDSEVRIGRAFQYASGTNGEQRYWSKDERHVLRERVLDYAQVPALIASLKSHLQKVVPQTGSQFAEGIVRELIGEDLLFEHLPKKPGGSPLFGTIPPPPPISPLEQADNKKALAKLVEGCTRLSAKAKISLDAVIAALRLAVEDVSPKASSIEGTEPSRQSREPPEPEVGTIRRTDTGGADELIVEERILNAVEKAPVVSLAELRCGMPENLRGKVFDEVVIRLADQRQVDVSQDYDPSSLTAEDRANYVTHGMFVYNTVTKRG